GELSRRLARVARNDKHVLDVRRLQGLEDLTELGSVTDQPRREVRDGAVAELAEAHGELDGRRQSATGRGGDGERDLFRHVGRDQVEDVVGRKDLVARRAEEPGQRLPHTQSTERPHHATNSALYATVALYATNPDSKRLRKKQERVAVERGSRVPRVEAPDRHVAGQLAVQAGQAFPVVIEHGAGDPELAAAGLEQLDQAGLTGPVDERAGRNLPEAMAAAARGASWRDPVGVDMAVQPEHDVAKTQQQVQQRVRATLGSGVREGVVSGVGEDGDVAVSG